MFWKERAGRLGCSPRRLVVDSPLALSAGFVVREGPPTLIRSKQVGDLPRRNPQMKRSEECRRVPTQPRNGGASPADAHGPKKEEVLRAASAQQPRLAWPKGQVWASDQTPTDQRNKAGGRSLFSVTNHVGMTPRCCGQARKTLGRAWLIF